MLRRDQSPGSIGIRLLAIFFAFGATMCALTLFLLLKPGTPLDAAWRLNPGARESFRSLGVVSVLLMSVVGLACSSVAIGLWRQRVWGARLAIFILTLNLVGDTLNAIVRHDYRALIGIPIAILFIVHLVRWMIRKDAALAVAVKARQNQRDWLW